MNPLERRHLSDLRRHLQEPRPLVQVLVGPRQVGKTTTALQLAAEAGDTAIYATADEAGGLGTSWIETQWARARSRAKSHDPTLLVLDEIQKVPEWSSAVKRLVDEDRRRPTDVRVLLLGSAALLIDDGLNESLAGRFERTWMGQWTWPEMREAFGTSLDDYVRFGGYPGAAPLRSEPQRWAAFVRDAIVETTIGRDVLQVTRVEKPALLRAVFDLACAYSSRELSYQKMIGQLQDAGNTTTVAHYLELLHRAGMVRGLQKFAGRRVRRRASSPKLLALDTGLVTATQHATAIDQQSDPERWGALVETCVGAHLNHAHERGDAELFYWRDGGNEVDFILRRGDQLLAIEVKSGRPRKTTRGMDAFRKAYPEAKILIVGNGGIPLEEFLAEDVTTWW